MNQEQLPRDALGTAASAALGITRDAIPLVSTMTGWLFDASAYGAAAGFRAGDTVMGAASNAALTTAAGVAALGAAGVIGLPLVAGVCVSAAAVKAGHLGLSAAAQVTQGGLLLGKRMVEGALETTDQVLEDSGVPSGTTLRLAVGSDASTAILFVRSMCTKFAIDLPPDMNWQQLTAASQALAWLQHTAGTGGSAQPVHPPPDTLEWARIRRHLRFALAAYGHLGLKALRVLPVLDTKVRVASRHAAP